MAKQKMTMEKFCLLEADLGKDLAKRASPQFLQIPSLSMRVVLDIPSEALAALKKNPMLLQVFYDGLSKVRNRCLLVLQERLVKQDDLAGVAAVAGSADASKKVAKQFEKELKAVGKLIESQSQSEIQAAWKKFVTAKKEYKAHKIKIAVTLAMGVCLTTGMVALVVTTPVTAGAGFVLGAFGALRATSSLMQELTTAYRSAESIQKTIHKDLQTYREVIAKRITSKSGSGVFEISGKMLKSFTGDMSSYAVPTLGDLGKNIKIFSRKLDGIETQISKVAKAVEKNITLQERITADSKALNDYCMKTLQTVNTGCKAYDLLIKKSKQLTVYKDSLEKLALVLDKKLLAIDNMNDRLHHGRDQLAGYVKILEDLTQGRMPSWGRAGALVATVVDVSMSVGVADWSNVAKTAVAISLKIEKGVFSGVKGQL